MVTEGAKSVEGKPDKSLHIGVNAAVDHICRLQAQINEPQVGAASVDYVTKALNGILMCLVPVRDEYERRHGPCAGVGHHKGPWEHVEGSDALSRCTACGEVSGK